MVTLSQVGLPTSRWSPGILASGYLHLLKKIFNIYLLAAPGLSCSLQDVPSSLRHTGSLAAARQLLLASHGIQFLVVAVVQSDSSPSRGLQHTRLPCLPHHLPEFAQVHVH